MCMLVSTKVHCHPSNANRSSQCGVQKKEKLYSGEPLANQGNPKYCSTEIKGRPHFLERVPSLVLYWFIFMQIRNPNRKVLLGPNSIVLIDWL